MFKPDEILDGTWMVRAEIPFDGQGVVVNRGSYNVLPARLLGFTYPDYLRFCMAQYNGILRGRAGYSYCVYRSKEECQKLCDLLDGYWKEFVKELNNG